MYSTGSADSSTSSKQAVLHMPQQLHPAIHLVASTLGSLLALCPAPRSLLLPAGPEEPRAD